MLFRSFAVLPAMLTVFGPVFCQAPAARDTRKDAPSFPVAMKQTRPQQKKVPPKDGVPAVDQYPFGRLIGELEGTDPSRPAPAVIASDGPQSEVPKDWPMLKDVPLSPTARQALRASQPWTTEKQTPAPGKE